MAPTPATPNAEDSGKEKQPVEENSGGAIESADKSLKTQKKSTDSFEETIFEKISTPQKPATVTMPHRWERENERDIEQMRKVYRDEMPLRGKTTQSDFSALSQDTGQSERSKSPMQSRERIEAEPASCAVKEEQQQQQQQQQQKTVEVEPAEKTICHRTVEVEPRTEQPQTEGFERSERTTRRAKAKKPTTPEKSKYAPLSSTSPTYFTAMTSPHRSASSGSGSSSIDRSSRSQKSSEKKASYNYNLKDFASSVASHTKNVFTLGGLLKKETDNDTSRKSERKQRHVHTEHSSYGTTPHYKNQPKNVPQQVATTPPDQHGRSTHTK